MDYFKGEMPLNWTRSAFRWAECTQNVHRLPVERAGRVSCDGKRRAELKRMSHVFGPNNKALLL